MEDSAQFKWDNPRDTPPHLFSCLPTGRWKIWLTFHEKMRLATFYFIFVFHLKSFCFEFISLISWFGFYHFCRSVATSRKMWKVLKAPSGLFFNFFRPLPPKKSSCFDFQNNFLGQVFGKIVSRIFSWLEFLLRPFKNFSLRYFC